VAGRLVKARELIERHARVWSEATRHPFLDGVRDGTLPEEAFEAWLAQDYLFVSDMLVFQARLLARAPRSAQAVVVGGLAAIEEELGWFEGLARERGISLDIPRHPTTAAYRRLLCGLEDGPYPAGIAALWAIELAYLEAWRGAAPGHPDYRPFVEHWTVPEFAGYVDGLEEAADAALGRATEGEQEGAEEAFLAVARLERDFWGMAFAGGSL
jgi:thiaminase